MIPWHRLLGMTMTHVFKGSCFKVDAEVDLALKAQRLDLLLLRRTEGPIPAELPDGLEELERFNLITYKSINEPLDSFAIHELVGHYTNCRKLYTEEELKEDPDGVEVLVERKRSSDEFELFGLTTAFPKNLAAQTELKRVSEGVYDIMAVGKRVRIIVLSEIPDAPRNGLWNLFSAQQEKVVHGAAHLKLEDSDLSSIINELLSNYQTVGINMSYTMEDFRRDAQREVLSRLTPTQLASALTPEQRLSGLTPTQLASALSPTQLASALSPEQRVTGLTPAQLASALASTLSPEESRQLTEAIEKRSKKP